MKIIIIGSGPAGADLALLAAKDKHEVLLMDPQFGGTCLNVGCIPTKSLLEEAFHLAKVHELDESFKPTQYTNVIYQKTQQVIDDLKMNLRKQLSGLGVQIIEQKVHFLSSQSVQSEDGQIFSSDRIVIATGAQTTMPLMFQNFKNIHISSSLLKQPLSQAQRFAVIGAGIIGCEMASFLKMMGHQVSLFETQSSILSTLPKDLAQSMLRDFKQNGIDVFTDVNFKKVEAIDDKFLLVFNDVELNFDQILVATGRRANVDSLHLENTSVKLEGSLIAVDENYQTSDPFIYALGDVSSKVQLAHLASFQAKDYYYKHFKAIDMGTKAIPNVLYTPLQAAWISEPGHVFSDSDQVFKAPLTGLAKQKIKLNTRGSLKLVLNSEDQLVHAEILSVDAAELIGICSLWMESKVNLKSLKNSVLPHPALVEAFSLIFHQF